MGLYEYTKYKQPERKGRILILYCLGYGAELTYCITAAWALDRVIRHC